MQKKLYLISALASCLSLGAIRCVPAGAQERASDPYLSRAGEYAAIYNGRLEPAYNVLLYKGLPYYQNADYAAASIVYRNNYYPDQKARLDLFKEQLILLTPGKQYGVVLDSRQVEKVYIHHKTFVRLTPKESGMASGYYIQLFEGKQVQLLCKEKYYPRKELQQKQAVFYFDGEKRYYVRYKDRYRAVKNKTSFVRLFPQYKAQINRFVKENGLNFKQSPDESFTALAAYCEDLSKP
jgi:hypothetical protein